MINYLWAGLMLVSIIFALMSGRLEAVQLAATEGAGEGVSVCIALLGVTCLWSGLMKIASETGLVRAVAFLLRPLTKLLFPDLRPSSPAMNAIVMNMTANILGVSNAATPLGLAAMRELAKESRMGVAGDNICMFVVVNTASIQLIPTTVIALRQTAGSAAPAEIIGAVWICSLSALVVGVTMAKLLQRRSRC